MENRATPENNSSASVYGAPGSQYAAQPFIPLWPKQRAAAGPCIRVLAHGLKPQLSRLGPLCPDSAGSQRASSPSAARSAATAAGATT
jgi:hypothetical protein